MPAAQRRKRYGLYSELVDDLHQVRQTRSNVAQMAARSPMTLGWKVDDPTRTGRHKAAQIINMHVPQPDAPSLAGSQIGVKHRRISATELQRYPLAHDTFGVDCIDQCLDIGLEQISANNLDHW